MKAILMTAPGGLNVLKLSTIAQPTLPGPNQLMVALARQESLQAKSSCKSIDR
ncbi:MAG TPA: hypothetical protein VM937_06165 [Burkholderiaceae bacterium]|jgi:NADPH:quinone reductase-like Zn-dependent oxidoreductase|nr:hypothetical protein [Burkholderiaceae bacterium]